MAQEVSVPSRCLANVRPPIGGVDSRDKIHNLGNLLKFLFSIHLLGEFSPSVLVFLSIN